MNKSIIFLAVFLGGSLNIIAQSDTSTTDKIKDFYKKDLSKAQVDILYSYYEQDGNNSPVTGGIGTEYLTDHVGKLIVNVPIGNDNYTLLSGIDYYTSASTDNINPASISSASVKDTRSYFDLSWSREKNARTSFGANAGFSTEWDVTSLSLGAFYARTSKDGNRQFNISGQAFNDNWSLIYPVELRRDPTLPKGNEARRVFDLTMSWSQVINKRLQATLSLEGIYQAGLLSTPFHRVYFEGGGFPKVESLPDSRIKIPIGISANYYLNDFMVLRSYYRYYQDDFDIRSHTVSLEVPIKLGGGFAVSPFYRFYTQTASKYFAPYEEHLTTDEFYTSDYDQAAFDSHKYGFGLRYSPLDGIWNTGLPWVKNTIQLKKIEFRTARYERTNGLEAYIFSIGFGFNLY